MGGRGRNQKCMRRMDDGSFTGCMELGTGSRRFVEAASKGRDGEVNEKSHGEGR